MSKMRSGLVFGILLLPLSSFAVLPEKFDEEFPQASEEVVAELQGKSYPLTIEGVSEELSDMTIRHSTSGPVLDVEITNFILEMASQILESKQLGRDGVKKTAIYLRYLVNLHKKYAKGSKEKIHDLTTLAVKAGILKKELSKSSRIELVHHLEAELFVLEKANQPEWLQTFVKSFLLENKTYMSASSFFKAGERDYDELRSLLGLPRGGGKLVIQWNGKELNLEERAQKIAESGNMKEMKKFQKDERRKGIVGAVKGVSAGTAMAIGAGAVSVVFPPAAVIAIPVGAGALAVSGGIGAYRAKKHGKAAEEVRNAISPVKDALKKIQAVIDATPEAPYFY